MISYLDYSSTNITKNTIFTFDIEVSSYWKICGSIVGYDKEIPDIVYNESEKGAIPYLWQFGVEDCIYYGRKIEDFKIFLETILKNQVVEKIYIYVHNLAYEFQFLRNIFDFKKVFARNERKPMKASIYIGKKEVEFRCSYTLTRLNLETWGDSLGIKKLVDSMDYSVLRTPNTTLDSSIMKYGERDIEIMYKGLCKYRDKYGSIDKIPLTQTGEVRRVVKEMFKKNTLVLNQNTALLPKDADEYKIFKATFAGGDTHGNPIYIGKILKDVNSYDETSGYPSFMVRKKFPSTKFRKCDNIHNLNIDKYAYIIGIRMFNVKAKGNLHYISRHRMLTVKNGFCENGRVINAEEITAYITELDFEIIRKTYDFDFEIISLRKSIKDYLHTDLIKFILQLFANKTELKKDNQTESEYNLYMQSKQFINSLFGMTVTDIVPLEVEYTKNEWKQKKVNNDTIEEVLQNLKKNKYKNFNAYTTGIWVTAYGRYELWNTMLKFPEDDIIYFDTDSIKFLNNYDNIFEKQNENVSHETLEAMRYHGLADNEYIKTSPKGIKCILGFWDKEKPYQEFVTLGAKKYAYIQNDKIHVTVSGVPKKASVCLKSLEDFKDGFIFDRDICQKNLTTYLDGDNLQGYINKGKKDEYFCEYKYGINIRNCGYTLGLTQEFKNALENLMERGFGRYE